jgi:hypothetical protein
MRVIGTDAIKSAIASLVASSRFAVRAGCGRRGVEIDQNAFVRSRAKTGEDDIGSPIISQRVWGEFTTRQPLARPADASTGSWRDELGAIISRPQHF